MLPTVSQLKEMFERLKVKINCSGFADVLLGFNLMALSLGSAMEGLCLHEASENTHDQEEVYRFEQAVGQNDNPKSQAGPSIGRSPPATVSAT